MDDTGSGRTSLAWGRGHVRHGRIPEWLLDSDASDRAIRLYALLATYADRNGSSFPGRAKIAKRLGCGETAYKSAVRELVRVGALDVEDRYREDGARTSNLYTLNWDQPGAIATGDGRESDRGSDADAPGFHSPELRTMGKEEDLAAVAAGAPVGPPKLTKIDGRDVAFDALAEVCGVDPSGNRAREIGVALNGSKRSGLARGIREMVWREADDPELGGEAFEVYLVTLIRIRAQRYREMMRGAALTPLALAKWWTDIDAAATSRDPAQAAFAEAQRLAEEGQ